MTGGRIVLEFDPEDQRPLPYCHAPGVRWSKVHTSEGGTEYFLKAPTGDLLGLGEHELFLWELLDGTNSFADIEREFSSRFDMGLTDLTFASFLAELLEAGAVEQIPKGERLLPSETKTKRIDLLSGGMTLSLAADNGSTHGATGSGSGSGLGGRAPERSFGAGQMRRMPKIPVVAQNPAAGEKQPWSIDLGNPEKFFGALVRIFWPVHRLCWLLVVLVPLGFLIYTKHNDEFMGDFLSLLDKIWVWPCLWLAEHTINWSSRCFQGVVIHGFGGKVTKASLKFVMGIFIRAKFHESSVRQMPQRAKLWVNASPLLFRLAVFSICTILWIMHRQTHPIVAQIALFQGFMALITFCIVGCPIIPAYGGRVVAILIGQEDLHVRAYKFLWQKLRGYPNPEALSLAERWGLLFLAVGSILYVAFFVGHFLHNVITRAVGAMGGVGIWFAMGIIVSAVLYYVALSRFRKNIRALHRAARGRRHSAGMARDGLHGG